VVETTTYAALMLLPSLTVLVVAVAHDAGMAVQGAGGGVLFAGVMFRRGWRSQGATLMTNAQRVPPDCSVETVRRTMIRALVQGIILYIPLAIVMLLLSPSYVPYAGDGALAGIWLVGCVHEGYKGSANEGGTGRCRSGGPVVNGKCQPGQGSGRPSWCKAADAAIFGGGCLSVAINAARTSAGFVLAGAVVINQCGL
jgi:hypothetical protein